MKRITNYLMVLALMAFTFTSCEDVPTPFGITPPGADDEVVTVDPAGKGTQAEPYNVQATMDLINSLEADASSDVIYTEGYISNLGAGVSTQYWNAQFYISDTPDGSSGQLLVYRSNFLNNEPFTSADQIKEGDKVIMCGKVKNYKGNTPEFDTGTYIYSINGSTEGGEKPVTPTDAKAVTIAEFNAAEVSTDVWYQLTGTVKNLKDGDKYGNFDIEDATGSVYVYGLLSEKGGEKQKFQELATAKGIKEGSKITIIGNRGAYNEKIEVVNAYFVSVEGGSDTPAGGAAGSGTQADPYNIAAAIAKCKEIGESASTEKYYVKGFVVKGGTVSGGYGNVTFTMGDTKDATDVFTAYQVAGSDGEKLADGYTVNAGDEVVVYGPIYNYKGNTPETAGKSAAQIVTINGKKTNESGSAGGNDGSESKPFNIAEAIAKCQEIGQTASSEKYYVKGFVVKGGTVSGGYGNVTFTMGDTKDATDVFTAYQVAGSDGEKLADGYTVNAGDEVVVYGPIYNYKGNTPETAGKSAAQIVTINGKKTNASDGGGNGGSGTGADGSTVISISDFNAAAESTSVWYQLTGTVKNLKDGDIYGNFDLEDATGSVYVYGVLSEKGGAKKLFQELVTKYGIKNGTTLTIVGNRGSYKNTIEVVNAYFISATN